MSDFENVPASLRVHFRRHNLTALALAFVSLLVAILSWGALYVFAKWLFVLGASIVAGVDAPAARNFTPIFFVSALALCIAAAGVRWLWPRGEAVDRRAFWENLLDVVLAVPRITLGAWGNLSAVLFLTRGEMALAWQLLQRIAAQKQIPLENIAVEIPAPPRVREKILLALQLSDLVFLKKNDDGFFLAIRGGGKAEQWLAPRVRIETPGRARWI